MCGTRGQFVNCCRQDVAAICPVHRPRFGHSSPAPGRFLRVARCALDDSNSNAAVSQRHKKQQPGCVWYAAARATDGFTEIRNTTRCGASAKSRQGTWCAQRRYGQNGQGMGTREGEQRLGGRAGMHGIKVQNQSRKRTRRPLPNCNTSGIVAAADDPPPVFRGGH